MYELFYKIVQSMILLRKKIKKLDDYWSKTYGTTNGQFTVDDSSAFTMSVNTPGTNVTLSGCDVLLCNNILRITIDYKLSSQISSGTSVKRKICEFTITDKNNLLKSSFSWQPGTLGGTGPIATHQVSDGAFTANSDGTNTITGRVYLCGTAGGAMAANSSFNVEFFALTRVNMDVN